MSRYDVLFIGTAIVDAIVKGFDPQPVSATGYRAESCALHAGGEAVNGAVAAAKLGMKAAILCPLGKDAAGAVIEAELAANGVDTGLVARSAEHPTPVTVMFVAEDGSRRSITNQAHRYNFHPEQYTEALSDVRAVVLGSLFRAPFDDPDVVRKVAEAAHAKGAAVFADTKLPNFIKLRLEDIADSLPMIDCITPNEEEARYYSGEDEPEKMADVFLAAGAPSVIIKLGGKGCFFKNREKSVYLPAYPIAAADASGAGDNFLAGYVCETLRGSGIDSALAFANACGAICTTAVGAGTALRDRQQVLTLIREMSER